jgi:hypothetical protein
MKLHLALIFFLVLTTYEAMLKSQPKAQNAFMDDLVAKRSNGTLPAYVLANNCKDKR